MTEMRRETCLSLVEFSGRKVNRKTETNTHRSDLSITAIAPLAGTLVRRSWCCGDSAADGCEHLLSNIMVPAMLSTVGCPDNADGHGLLSRAAAAPRRGRPSRAPADPNGYKHTHTHTHIRRGRGRRLRRSATAAPGCYCCHIILNSCFCCFERFPSHRHVQSNAPTPHRLYTYIL